jgi:hypothetical protein
MTGPGFACLDCGAPCPVHTSVTGAARPSPGDISICWTCGHLMAFADADGRVRALTEAEVVEVAGDPRIVRSASGAPVRGDDAREQRIALAGRF